MKGGIWLGRISRGVILLVPAGLIVYRGGFYLLETFRTLLAPGTGIQLALATPRGPVRFSARGYAIDPRTGSARLDRVRVVDAGGRLLARAERVRVEGLDLRGGLRPSATLTDPFIRVRREVGGGLDLTGYLPPRQGEASDIPYEVRIIRGRIELEDLAARGRPLYEISLPTARVAGRG
ncbi:MAG: hypothetical protein C4320_09000, partial [Armatimonadota bacterium]